MTEQERPRTPTTMPEYVEALRAAYKIGRTEGRQQAVRAIEAEIRRDAEDFTGYGAEWMRQRILNHRIPAAVAGRAVQDDGLPTDSPERRFLLGMVDTLYGGGEKPEDLSARLLVIADVLDKVDAVTDAYVAEKGADHRVGRSFQADLREAAARLRAAPPLHDPTERTITEAGERI